MTVKEVIALTAVYYGQQLPDPVLLMQADDLKDLPSEEVIKAYQTYRRNPKNVRMPLPAQIRAIVQPEVDPDFAAREIADRIVGAVPKYGWPNGKDARLYIGEVGWSYVQRLGGWSWICESMGSTINPDSFKAQARESLKGHLLHSPQQIEKAITGRAEPRPGLQSANDIMKSLLGNKEET